MNYLEKKKIKVPSITCACAEIMVSAAFLGDWGEGGQLWVPGLMARSWSSLFNVGGEFTQRQSCPG